MKIIVALAALVLAGCSSQTPSTPAAKKAEPAKPPVAITQFYPTAPRIGRGEQVELCYGVDNATKVALEPPIEKVWPALARCFAIRPASTATYTLTAWDDGGRSASKSVTIEVGGAATKAGAAGPHIIQVTVNKLQIAAGEPVLICYTARNAASVKITPGQGTGQTAERGCVTDNPKATTTYQVVATGAAGQTDSERVTVKVR
jgi:hypothetical protein